MNIITLFPYSQEISKSQMQPVVTTQVLPVLNISAPKQKIDHDAKTLTMQSWNLKPVVKEDDTKSFENVH